MKCPLCDEIFDSDENLTNHLDDHINKSDWKYDKKNKEDYKENIIDFSDDSDSPDFEKILGKEKFEKEVSRKLNSLKNIEELVERHDFISKIVRIITKYPFVYLEHFIEDFVNGTSSTKIVEKYHFRNFLEPKYLVKNILHFKEERFKHIDEINAREKNLAISNWNEKYKKILDNCNFFREELLNLLFNNILRAYIILHIVDFTEGVEKKSIVEKSKSLLNDIDIFRMINSDLLDGFTRYLQSNLEVKVSELLDELLEENLIHRRRGNSHLLQPSVSFEQLQNTILDILTSESGGIRQRKVQKKLLQKHPVLRLVPGLRLWEIAIKDLEDKKIVKRKPTFHFVSNDLLFISSNYERIMSEINNLEKPAQSRFYGRYISSEEFLEELKQLEKGDFEDSDDQVTRIAGLVLTQSTILRTPHEYLPEFDFVIDLENFQFTEEHFKVMSETNFKAKPGLMHVKVMINEKVHEHLITEIESNLPKDEQAVIITLQEIPETVKHRLNGKHSIQIIGEKELLAFAKISPVIPCRNNSVVIIKEGELKNSIARIDSINYETGLAVITLLQNKTSRTYYVGHLEEIPLKRCSVNEFGYVSKNYFEFLTLLYACAPNTLIEGLLHTQVKNISPKFSENKKIIRHGWDLELENVSVGLRLVSYDPLLVFNCQCYHMINQEHSFTLCNHVVASLNRIAIEHGYLELDNLSDKNNTIKNALRLFLKFSLKSSLNKLRAYLPKDQIPTLNYYISDYVMIRKTTD